jgi:3-mercaptopyruvate sulfurtransferase SseA
VAWDLRASGPVLPGAARIAPQALQAWLTHADTAALSQAVSTVGLNLSAEVLLVADDDATAQAVADRLRPLARGRLAWLAGGTTAWQAAGLPLDAAPTRRLPMPQRLTPAAPASGDTLQASALADAARRATVTFGVVPQAQAAANSLFQRR